MADAVTRGRTERGGGARRRPAAIAAAAVAAVGQLVMAFFNVASGLLAPLWALALLWLLWAAAVAVGVRLVRRGSLWAAAVPLANAALWWLALMTGGALFDWTP